MEVKYYELELPSRLIPYKADGVTLVEVRMLKGRDEKLIGEFTLNNFEKKFKLLLDNVIRGIDPAKLTIGDRFFVLMWLAMNCYSNVYPIQLICEHCFRKTDNYEINLGELEKLSLPEDYVEPYAVTLTNGDVVNLRQFTVQDQINYVDFTAQREGKDDILFKLAQGLVDDNDMGKRIEYLEEMSTKDLGLIRAFYETFAHGVKLETGYTCPKCGGAGITPVPFRLDLLLPAGKTVAASIERGF